MPALTFPPLGSTQPAGTATSMSNPTTARSNRLTARRIAVALLILTIGQLAVATFVPGLSQFEGKGFGARLLLYPAMMLLVPASWLIHDRRRPSVSRASAPWAAFAWIMLPFLIDVTGNTLNLYDSITWWDDVNHLVNWLFLSLGVGLLVRGSGSGSGSGSGIRPGWALGLLIAGLGAMLAIGWEVGEYYAFIRGGTELQTAYTDTLGDEVLGTLGATLAALILCLPRHQRGAVQPENCCSDPKNR